MESTDYKILLASNPRNLSAELAATYAEGLKVVHGQSIAVKVEEGILKHAAVAVADDVVKMRVLGEAGYGRYSRENEAITVGEVGVLGVEVHELLEKNVSNGCHAPIIRLLAYPVELPSLRVRAPRVVRG